MEIKGFKKTFPYTYSYFAPLRTKTCDNPQAWSNALAEEGMTIMRQIGKAWDDVAFAWLFIVFY